MYVELNNSTQALLRIKINGGTIMDKRNKIIRGKKLSDQLVNLKENVENGKDVNESIINFEERISQLELTDYELMIMKKAGQIIREECYISYD